MGSDFSPYPLVICVNPGCIQCKRHTEGTGEVSYNSRNDVTYRLSVVKFEINIAKSAVSISKTMSYYRKGSAAPEDGQINSIFLCLNGDIFVSITDLSMSQWMIPFKNDNPFQKLRACIQFLFIIGQTDQSSCENGKLPISIWNIIKVLATKLFQNLFFCTLYSPELLLCCSSP